MEDSAIRPLEDVAAAYAEIRDQRIDLNREESSLKQTAIKLMHRYGKTIYKRDGITIRLVEGDEDVKVTVKAPGDPDEHVERPAKFAEARAVADKAEGEGEDAAQD